MDIRYLSGFTQKLTLASISLSENISTITGLTSTIRDWIMCSLRPDQMQIPWYI